MIWYDMIGIDVLPSNSLFWVRRASRTSVLSGCLVSKTPVDISILMGLTWVSLYLITSSAGAVTGLEWDCVREAPLPSAGRSVRTTMASQHYWASVSLSLSQLRNCRSWLSSPRPLPPLVEVTESRRLRSSLVDGSHCMCEGKLRFTIGPIYQTTTVKLSMFLDVFFFYWSSDWVFYWSCPTHIRFR